MHQVSIPHHLKDPCLPSANINIIYILMLESHPDLVLLTAEGVLHCIRASNNYRLVHTALFIPIHCNKRIYNDPTY